MAKQRRDTAQYLLRMTPEEKSELAELSRETGVPLSEAFRRGASQYLNSLADATVVAAASAEPMGDDGDLLAEFNATAARIQRRLSGR